MEKKNTVKKWGTNNSRKWAAFVHLEDLAEISVHSPSVDDDDDEVFKNGIYSDD